MAPHPPHTLADPDLASVPPIFHTPKRAGARSSPPQTASGSRTTDRAAPIASGALFVGGHMTPRWIRQSLLLLILAAVALALGAPHGAAIAAANDDDYATQELGHPWDMNSSSEIAAEYTSTHDSVSGLTFTGGLL